MKTMINPRDPDYLIMTFLAVLFVGIGLLTAFLLGKVSTFSCARADDADRCVLRQNWMGIAPLKETRIEDLQGAQVETSCDDDGCTYRVLILTARQNFPLIAAYSSGQQSKERMVDQINAFVKDRSIPSLEVRDGGGFWMIFPLIFLVVGLGMAVKPLIAALRTIFPSE
jgi:hypothetical protein